MRKTTTELNIEEAIFAESRREPDYLELPLSRQTFALLGALAVLLSAAIAVRIGFLGILKNEAYANRAAANVNKYVILPAPRGVITDRFGKPLVENKSAFTVFVNAAELLKSPDDLEKAVKVLSGILRVEEDKLRETILAVDLEKRVSVPIARNVSLSQTIAIKDLGWPGVQISDDYWREYPDGPIFSHVLGFIGISETSSDIVGKSGLEAAYDYWLQGKNGQMIVYRDAAGAALETKVAEAPEVGKKLATTLDADLQKFFYQRLRSGLLTLGREAGVGLAIDPRNGEILALISLPSFDNNRVPEFLNAKNQPLFNRAISGAYAPGSTIKPLVAVAALKEEVITPDFQVLSLGAIEIPNPYNPEKPSRFLDWKAHGWVNLYSAIARSSNIFFYALGGGLPKSNPPIAGLSEGFKGLGIERLNEYWKKFLLGQKTGIDLPGESAGSLPNPEEKERRTGEIWRIGDTYNVSIGQGDLLVTPLQLLNFIASIANGGKIHRPRLVLDSQESVLLDYSGWYKEIADVRKGMEDAVSKYYGTANLLAALSVPAAGKTGSAQTANNTKTNAFFVGYLPAENPEIAVLVLIENAKEGSLNAVPIAKDVLEWYYWNRIYDS